jgi:hypothetical protein
VLAYDGLAAIDADGRELPARVELSDKTVLLRIDDRSARYPVMVDPFLSKGGTHP